MALDPSTIPVPPKPTATSTTAEWSNYVQYVRAIAEIELSAAADRQTLALEKLADSQAQMAAAIRDTGMPPSVTETTFIRTIELLRPFATPSA